MRCEVEEYKSQLEQREKLLSKHEKELKEIYDIKVWDKNIPDLAEIFDVISYMTPMMREKIMEYLSYYWLSLAQDSLYQENKDKIVGAFTTLKKLKEVFEWLKLKQVKQWV